MTYDELRNRVKDIMTNAKFEHCKDVSVTNTGKWCINQMIYPLSIISGKKLPKPFFMDEHIKFIYKGRDDREEYDTILIHVEIVDYDGMLVVPSVQIQLTADSEEGELKCTYTEGSGGKSSIINSIGFVVHERTRELLKDIYDEVIKNGRSTH